MSGELDRLGHPEAGSLAGTPGIGVIGAGWIVRECHLPSYAAAGAEVVGITSRDAERCRDLAAERGIRAFESWEALVDEPAIEVVDIAYPPDVQPELIARIAARGAGIRGILAQKPLAPTLAEAAAAVRACEEHGVVLAVNQNMRWDHSIRALKRLLDDGRLGEPVMAQITMHARVGWMPYAEHYPRKGMLIMSVHHLDAFRFLFGDPSEIVASVRAAPGTDGADEMAAYTLRYPEGLLAVGIDNTYATLDQGIEWRVDGTGGAARGTLGWPDHPWGAPAPCATSASSTPSRCWNRTGRAAGSRTPSRRRWPSCSARSPPAASRASRGGTTWERWRCWRPPTARPPRGAPSRRPT